MTLSSAVLNDESKVLYAASSKLTQALTPIEQLEAVSDYARGCGASEGVLFYLNSPDEYGSVWIEVVAEWSLDDQPPVGIGTRFLAATHRTPEIGEDLTNFWMNAPDSPLLLGDTTSEERLDVRSRALFDTYQMRATAMLPLNNKGRWVGLIIFSWREPHRFDERDQRIYTALIQQAVSAIDSLRLFEQTQRRALELEIAYREMDILYAASSKLAGVSTPSDLLDAISGYARDQHADMGMLVYWHSDNDGAEPTYGEVVAEWFAGDTDTHWMGKRLKAFQISSEADLRLATLDQPVLIEDVTSDPSASEQTRRISRQYGYNSFAMLPLHSKGRWLGLLEFSWRQPRAFSERDRRVFNALIQQAAPVLDSLRWTEDNRIRAVRAEHLLGINTALSRAKDEASILESIAQYTTLHGSNGIFLNYIDLDDRGDIITSRPVAVWRQGESFSYDDFPLKNKSVPMSKFGIDQLWVHQQDRVLFVENVATDSRIPEKQRAGILDALQTRAFALLPLQSAGRCVGAMNILWFEPHAFSEEEVYIYTALLQMLPAVVARRRAYLAEEEARQESEMLYRISEAINAATSYEEIIYAVAEVDNRSQAIFLSVWENYRFEGASYLEVMAAVNTKKREPLPDISQRIPTAALPVSYRMYNEKLWVFEDVLDDPRIDPVTAATWQSLNTRAIIGTTLHIDGHWAAGLTFHSDHPRNYTARDRRLTAGIGDLVLAAFQRIRLQLETMEARYRAERLAQVNASLSRADDEWDILEAVSLFLAPMAPDYMALTYSNDLDSTGSPEALVRMAIWEDGALQRDHPLLNQSYNLEGFPSSQLWGEADETALMFGDTLNDPHLGDALKAYCAEKQDLAMVVIPLYSSGQWQGSIACSWRNTRTFTDYEREICEALIQTVGSVVASRRAYLAEQNAQRETELRARDLETVAKVSAAAASILNLDHLLATVADLTRVSFDQYRICIYLLDKSEKRLIRATNGHTDDDAPARSIEMFDKESLVVRVGQTRRGIIVNDITATPDFNLASILPEARSEMAVPMVAADRLIGVLDVQSREVNRFSEADIRVMSTLADLIAVAVQNARLYAQAQELAAFEERNRLARELHDSVSQALYGIALGARTARTLLDRDPSRLAEPLDYVLALAEAGLTEMRALIFDLRPDSLESEGLINALSKQAASLQTRHGIRVHVSLCAEPEMALEVKETLYRIAREALHNIVKHAQASQVTLRLDRDGHNIRLEVTDDGLGFDVHALFPGHLGLQSMRERTARLNGVFAIDSAPGRGTAIRIEIPTDAHSQPKDGD